MNNTVADKVVFFKDGNKVIAKHISCKKAEYLATMKDAVIWACKMKGKFTFVSCEENENRGTRKTRKYMQVEHMLDAGGHFKTEGRIQLLLERRGHLPLCFHINRDGKTDNGCQFLFYVEKKTVG